MPKKPIRAVKFLDGPFEQRRSEYSSSSIFVAILVPPDASYDAECIGEELFPDGFGCIDPPGPVDGFGALGTSADDDGRYALSILRKGKNAAELDPFMDGYFVVDVAGKCLREVTKASFHKDLKADGFETVHVVEFEPD